MLLAATRGDYLWWFNVGDVSLFLFHPEYARMGQFAVNQRSFFEWVGRTHTFADDVPCYATGTKRFRNGRNVVLLATDGLFEQPHALSDPAMLGSLLQATSPHLADGVTRVLSDAFSSATRDSVSVLAWEAPGQGAPESSS